ncbi:PPE domain-containing protein [Mycolicibacterium holsaticum]|uniref:Uncharacterized protein n=1 Tax=Mycolicibacterium holsaticum TaxID=152142 RepID=A0A1E3S2Y8_9MYCO|nr:hypothetical protein [Mycolicibacterium holsaticum]ODQ96042.1 hypothetical protein BHQ17_02720 [Mycolicibacterium holsaticum]
MSAEVRVNPAVLKAQAAAMRQLTWSPPAVQPIPPDALGLAKDAVDNLNEIARVLGDYQTWAEAENQRIAEMLDNAAAAYERVDEAYQGKLDDPARQAAIEDIALPAPSTALPALPSGPGAPRQPSAAGYRDVKRAHGDLSAGDHGASLHTAEVQWGLAATFVESHAAPRNITDWEGEAADTAHARMNAFSDWLHELSAGWQRLAQAAAKVAAAHLNANNQHIPIFARYVALEAQLAQRAAAGADVDAIVKELQNLQRLSDEVREDYAKNATVDPVRIGDPPGASRGGNSGGAGGATGPSGASGDAATGDPAAMAERMGESLIAPTSAAGAEHGDGPPSGGGAPSGGSPSGGAAGGAPSAAPGSPSTGAPQRPTDPGLRPAAAAGGGSGAGGGGGAGGGKGVGPQPLSPAVTAETVAPAPVPVTSAAAGAAPGPSTGAMAGGGMGMAPMHGAAGAAGGKEKRRNPDLAPDEDLYTEDRPWTEGVIGNRRRRESKDNP